MGIMPGQEGGDWEMTKLMAIEILEDNKIEEKRGRKF